MPARKHILSGVKIGFAKGEALRILKINPKHSTFKKNRTELKNTTTRGERGYLTKFWRNSCLKLSVPVKKYHFRLYKSSRTRWYGNATLKSHGHKTLKYILTRTDLWRQKFKIACGWRECHAGMSILQFLTGHLPLVLWTLREAAKYGSNPVLEYRVHLL